MVLSRRSESTAGITQTSAANVFGAATETSVVSGGGGHGGNFGLVGRTLIDSHVALAPPLPLPPPIFPPMMLSLHLLSCSRVLL